MSDPLLLYGEAFQSRLLLGTARYPSPSVMLDAIASSGAEIITASLRRQSPEHRGGEDIWGLIRSSGCRILPNTAGCRTAREAVTLAEMCRELFETDWIKLEVTGDEYNLQPDPFELVEAAGQLVRAGFRIFPYTTEDLVLCCRLRDLGCEVVMPWGAPIGTGRGLLNPYALSTLRDRLADISLVVDAGLGRASHVAQALEIGFDAVLLNTSVSRADDPPLMASAMREAASAGRKAYLAGHSPISDVACPSTSVVGTPFWSSETSQEAE